MKAAGRLGRIQTTKLFVPRYVYYAVFIILKAMHTVKYYYLRNKNCDILERK